MKQGCSMICEIQKGEIDMYKNMKFGGMISWMLPTIYLIGIIMKVAVLDTTVFDNERDIIVFLAQKDTILHIWITLLYIVFGILLIFLSESIKGIMATYSPYMANVTAVVGLI